MRKLLLILLFPLFLISEETLNVDERQVDFYFGNGVWNTDKDAEKSKDRLAQLIRSDIKITQYSEVKLAYNWTYGEFDDLIETFFQLQEEGQLKFGFFVAVGVLLPSNPYLQALFLGVTAESILQAMQTEEKDIRDMLKAYNDSINQGHRVILISHSQGNLFGVRAYDRLKSWQKKYFKQVSVATPANRVVGNKNRYVTVENDWVIDNTLSLIANILPANAENKNTGYSDHHEFVSEYLNGDVTRGRIISMIRDTYTESLATPSQWRPIGNETCTIDGCDAIRFYAKV